LKNFGVLIICFARPENLRKIVEMCISHGFNHIYIAIDGCSKDNINHVNNIEVKRLATALQIAGGLKIKILEHSKNIGCAVSVLSACNWLFEHEGAGVIIEDDCIPGLTFFEYIKSALRILNDKSISDNIWIASAYQPIQNQKGRPGTTLSNYPMTWGWVTTKSKWKEIELCFKQGLGKIRIRDMIELGVPDYFYWRNGARRAYEGYVDVWDTILAYKMLINNKRSIIPYSSQIINIGNDPAAVHTLPTLKSTKGLHGNTGNYIEDNNIVSDRELNVSIRNIFYEIKLKHLFTTNINYLLDNLFRKSSKKSKLINRWNSVNSRTI